MTNLEKYYNEQIKTFAAQPFHQLTQNQVNYLKTSSGFVYWKWRRLFSGLTKGIKQLISF
ncbi:MAG TPA: hypothetical protein VEV62_03555 [Parafilimonas sp.]|nr:hypothetical protein [Parafilimonas sp.]